MKASEMMKCNVTITYNDDSQKTEEYDLPTLRKVLVAVAHSIRIPESVKRVEVEVK